MKSNRFEWTLGAVLLALWLALWLWQNPGFLGSRIGAEDAARYTAAIEKLPMPPEERAQMLQRARAWMDSDDGKPVYMLNLMRLYPKLRDIPGALEFKGTPRESNAFYENAVQPLLLKVGGYPMYAGNMAGRNILEFKPELDDWSRLLVVRYPSRRAFMELVSDPAYAPVAPYKLRSLSVVLSPTAGEMVIPELSLLLGLLFAIAFLLSGWVRSSRRRS